MPPPDTPPGSPPLPEPGTVAAVPGGLGQPLRAWHHLEPQQSPRPPQPPGIKAGCRWLARSGAGRGHRQPQVLGPGVGGQQLGARCAAWMRGPGAPDPQETAPPATAVSQDRGTGSHPGGVSIPLGPQDGVLLLRAVPKVGMALLSPDLWRGSVGWRDGDGAEQAAWPVTRLARSHHHPWPPQHCAWGQTRVAPHTPSSTDIGAGGHGRCPQGHTAGTRRDPAALVTPRWLWTRPRGCPARA